MNLFSTEIYYLDKMLNKTQSLIPISIQIIKTKKTAESIVSYHKVFVYIKYHHYINLWTENIYKNFFRLHEFLILRKMKEPLPFLHTNEMLYIKSSKKNKRRRWKWKIKSWRRRKETFINKIFNGNLEEDENYFHVFYSMIGLVPPQSVGKKWENFFLLLLLFNN
jgi:hypothetical protein